MKIEDVEVVAPNFKRRLSGVTSTILQLIPLQRETLGIATLGPGLPDGFPKLGIADLPKLWRRPKARPFRILHARRNVEMLAGIVLRDLCRMPMRLVFTSAAQRHHTAWTRFLIARMDAVIATSTRSASYLKRPATIVMHGVDLKRFGPDGPLPADLAAARLQGAKIVGCSGRIRHQKGTDLLVEAMLQLLPEREDWSAVITGRVTQENLAFATDLKARIEALDLSHRILFLGEVEEVASWFRRFDLYVAPPRNEGFGLTPLEAMASGTPVVASDAGAFRDMILENETGNVVPTDDAAALAAAIAPYLDDDDRRRRASIAALAHVRERFPLDREAFEIRAVYEKLWSEDPAAAVRSTARTKSASTTSVRR